MSHRLTFPLFSIGSRAFRHRVWWSLWVPLLAGTTALFGQPTLGWDPNATSVAAHATLDVAANNAPYSARDAAGVLHVTWMQADQAWYGRKSTAGWSTRALDRQSGGSIVRAPSLVVMGNAIYIAWVESGNVVITRSTDSGTTWAAPFTLAAGRHEAVSLTTGTRANGSPLLAAVWHDTAELNGFAYRNFSAVYSGGTWAAASFAVRQIANVGNSTVRAPSALIVGDRVYATWSESTTLPGSAPRPFGMASTRSLDAGITWMSPQTPSMLFSDEPTNPGERSAPRMAAGPNNRILFGAHSPRKAAVYGASSDFLVAAGVVADLGDGANVALATVPSRTLIAAAWERFSGGTAPDSAKTVGLALSFDGVGFNKDALPGAASETGAVRPGVNVTENTIDVFWVGTAGGTRTLRHRSAAIVYDPLGGPTVATNPQNPPRLANLSVRTTAGTGTDVLIVGVVVGGSSTAAAKPLLIRGIGPTLTGFGVGGALDDPQLAVYVGNTALMSNDNWETETGAAGAATQVAAFPLPAGSRDSVLFRTLEPRDYSVQINGRDGGRGIALAEIYEVGAVSATSSRLLNISARAQVGVGPEALFAGFAVGGEGRRRLLIRGVGPTLTQFGVSGTLANPKLELFRLNNGQLTPLIENDDWAASPSAAAIAETTRAVTFPLSSDADAALLVTLEPGTYSAKISGVRDTTGIALVEIYEAPEI